MEIDSSPRPLEWGYGDDTPLEGVSASEWGSQTENPTRNERWRTGTSIDWTATGTAWKET